jgi:CheY-like chemotaxis protein
MTDNGRDDLKGLRILVVEDMLLVAQEIESLLQDLGCEVVGPIPRLEQAVDTARSEDFDGAILDVNLDGRDVYPVAAELRSRGIPFFFITGYDQQILDPAYQDRPHLEKPFGAREFTMKLREAFLAGSASE